MHSKPTKILKSVDKSQNYDFNYECGADVISCPHSPGDSPIPFPDSSPHHSESSDDSCDFTNDRFFPAAIKEDFESIASILVALRSAPVIKNVPSSPVQSSKENVFNFSHPVEDNKHSLSSSEKEDQMLQSDSGSGESEIDLELEIDCDDEWNERIDGIEIKGSITKGSGGFACEKHKRWKKRCPSWCPMRKENFKNGKSSKISSDQPLESPNSSGSEVQFRRKRTYNKITVSSSPSELPIVNNTSVKVSTVNTIACQFHAQLHARCPLNCPDRRVKTNVRKKQKKSEDIIGRGTTF